MTIIKLMELKDKKVLIMGLGTLGGGLSSVKWFLNHGAEVTVTDLKTEKDLEKSLKKLGPLSRKIKFVLGRHDDEDFKRNDIVVINPAVPKESPFIFLAKKNKKILVNDARIFFDTVKNRTVAVTGTRGKTTTVNWIAHFLSAKGNKVTAAGNSSSLALLDLLSGTKNRKGPLVLELSSWQLELLPGAKRSPDVAVITNLYPDHLNRYESMKDYALAKANIFKNQKRNQKLILNKDNDWTSFFLKLKPKSKIYFFSKKPLGRGENGLFLKDGLFYLREGDKQKEVLSKNEVEAVIKRGEHNVSNFLAASLASYLAGVSFSDIKKSIKNLPDVKYREEVVLKRKNMLFVNDSAATSPDAVLAAILRFKNEGRVILITGGTDKNLNFEPMARKMKKLLGPEDVFFLEGSATKNLFRELKKLNYFGKSKPQLFENLGDILKAIRSAEYEASAGKKIVLFSPGAASFEKFKNEFDRGEKFDKLIRLNF